MKNLEELMADKRIGIVSAHPDDHLVHSNAIDIARDLGSMVHELTLTLGRASTVNHHPDEGFVKAGKREQEGIKAAALLGLASNEHWDEPDGGIPEQIGRLVPPVQRWMARHGLDVILTMGSLADHADHTAAGLIALGASQQLGVSTLELRPDGRGEWCAPVTASALKAALGAAATHASQFAEGDLPSLYQYPIHRDATYAYHPGAMQRTRLGV